MAPEGRLGIPNAVVDSAYRSGAYVNPGSFTGGVRW